MNYIKNTLKIIKKNIYIFLLNIKKNYIFNTY